MDKHFFIVDLACRGDEKNLIILSKEQKVFMI